VRSRARLRRKGPRPPGAAAAAARQPRAGPRRRAAATSCRRTRIAELRAEIRTAKTPVDAKVGGDFLLACAAAAGASTARRCALSRPWQNIDSKARRLPTALWAPLRKQAPPNCRKAAIPWGLLGQAPPNCRKAAIPRGLLRRAAVARGVPTQANQEGDPSRARPFLAPGATICEERSGLPLLARSRGGRLSRKTRSRGGRLSRRRDDSPRPRRRGARSNFSAAARPDAGARDRG
jgi:hypothetical protein